MNKKITVIKGDGIGPEVTDQALKVLNTIAEQYQYHFDYSYQLMGAVAIDATGQPLPEATLAACQSSDAILFGAIGHPKYDANPGAAIRPEQGLLQLRKALGLYTNVRPIHTYEALQHLSPLKHEKLKEVDFVIFRELTGGIYFGEKTFYTATKTAFDACTYSADEIIRVAHKAFQAAQNRKKHLTLVDKANVLETSRLWRKIINEMSGTYPDVTVDYMYVDNAAMQMLLNPKQFDVLLTENMFGDILSDEASVLSGSLGLLPSASYGDGPALFEPIHGSYPEAAGKDIANPIGAILSAAMLLESFSMHEEANLIKEAVHWTIDNHFVTKDINPTDFYFTSTIGDLICEHINHNLSGSVKQFNVDCRKITII